jgi:hypothetical protein
MATYSFQDIVGTLVGPGAALIIGSDAGNSEEGIEVTPSEDRNQMTIGADGTPMHSLNANTSGQIAINLLKTSPQNALLQAVFDLQTLSSATHGVNVLVVSNIVGGDLVSARYVAFKRQPTLQYNKNPRMQTWLFDCGMIDIILGTGVPDLSV